MIVKSAEDSKSRALACLLAAINEQEKNLKVKLRKLCRSMHNLLSLEYATYTIQFRLLKF